MKIIIAKGQTYDAMSDITAITYMTRKTILLIFFYGSRRMSLLNLRWGDL